MSAVIVFETCSAASPSTMPKWRAATITREDVWSKDSTETVALRPSTSPLATFSDSSTSSGPVACLLS